MTTRMLVPIDESTWSQAALDTAIDLAQRARLPVSLHLLHVVNVTTIQGRLVEDLSALLGLEPVLVPQKVAALYRARGQALLDAALARAAHAGVSATATLDQGAVVDCIVKHGNPADLVVMGSRGDTEQRFPGQGGGTADRILRRGHFPTLITTDRAIQLRRVALAYDGSVGADLALALCLRLASLVELEVVALHIAPSPPQPDPLAPALARLTEAGVVVHARHATGEARDALPAQALAAGCDVLALGHRGHAALKDIFLGRTTEWLVGGVNLGLLVAR